MKKLLLSAAMMFAATMAQAAITADQVVASYQADGYSAIEVTTGLTQIKVEAVKGGTKMEVVYDIASGAILKQEQSTARPKDGGTKVEVSTSDSDFLGDGNDMGDDKGGSDDGSNHDMNDDHGGDNSGSDDDGSDDQGSDDQGSGDNSGSGSDNGGSDNGGSDNGGSDGDSNDD